MNDKSYLITYDLMSPGQNYNKIKEVITSFNKWANIQQSVWVISTSLSGQEVYDKIRTAIDYNDKLAVFGLNGAGWWNGLSKQVSDWLKDNL